MSINNGYYATNSTKVRLDVIWPAYSTKALISNDGGFGRNEGTRTVPLAPTIPWKLSSATDERVYLRFPDSANPTVTYTDDIILDTAKPTVQSASYVGRHGRLYKVRLRAHEKLSGICAARFSTRKHGGTTVVLRTRTRRGIVKLARTVAVKMAKKPRYVRVRSAAGNWSKWHRIR